MHTKRSILLGTSVLAGLMMATAPAFAQTTTTASQSSAQTRAEPESTTVSEVVVTGSRIRRNEFTSAQPIQVITAEQSELKGVADAATALMGSSLAAGSFQLNDQLTGYVTAGGGGTQSVALRGLGAQRTLTLLNGRRAGPAGTRGQVQAFDLNVIPQSIVERFDILKDGASSIYGSDAVAGVINVVTKRDIDGGYFSAYASQPFEQGGEVYSVSGSWGQTMDRGYFSVGGEYYRAEALRRADRDDTACTQDNLYDAATGERVDYIDPRTNDYKCLNLTNQYVSVSGVGSLVRKDLAGAAYNYNTPGNTSPYADWARFNVAGDPGSYLYAPTSSPYSDRQTVISPVERGTVTFFGGYDLTPNIELYTELLYNHRKSEQNGVAQVFQSFAQRNTVNGAPNVLPASNPNNPFGRNVQTVGVYESSSFQTVDYYRAVAGARGTFAAFDRNFDWDVYGQYSLSDAVYNNGPRIYLDRFLALNSPNVACTNTPLGGNVSNFNCADLPNGIPWASARVLAGDYTQAERDFLFITEEGTTTYDHAYIEGVISTDRLFTLPAGDVGFAFGAQVRHEKIDDTPPEQAANRNIALYTSAGRTTGSDDIREAFVEFEVPVLKALPFAESLDINLSGRISDYDSYGTNSTWKAGVNWQITPEYRLRAGVGTSFRAPALYELYLGNQTGYGAQSAVDPCYNYGANTTIDPNVLAACVALGIPANQTGGSSATIFSNGGAGVLEAETSKSQSYGVIWTPKFASLSVAVDYFDIEIKNEVSQFGAYNIIEYCLRGRTDFCSLFERDPTTNYITTVNNSYVNINTQWSRGIDLTIRYDRETPFGDLTFQTQNTWKLEDKVNTLGGEVEDYLGNTFNYNGPQYAGNASLTLRKGDLTWNYAVDAIGKGSDYDQYGYRTAYSAKYDTDVVYKMWNEFTTYHSASVRYRLDDWSFQIGVNNMFDERPPSSDASTWRIGTAALSGYDMRGRRGFIRVGRTF
ncbi:MAG: TonB-dependent receptor plug domain-containing protein [Brevundimonas sp.]